MYSSYNKSCSYLLPVSSDPIRPITPCVVHDKACFQHPLVISVFEPLLSLSRNSSARTIRTVMYTSSRRDFLTRERLPRILYAGLRRYIPPESTADCLPNNSVDCVSAVLDPRYPALLFLWSRASFYLHAGFMRASDSRLFRRRKNTPVSVCVVCVAPQI